MDRQGILSSTNVALDFSTCHRQEEQQVPVRLFCMPKLYITTTDQIAYALSVMQQEECACTPYDCDDAGTLDMWRCRCGCMNILFSSECRNCQRHTPISVANTELVTKVRVSSQFFLLFVLCFFKLQCIILVLTAACCFRQAKGSALKTSFVRPLQKVTGHLSLHLRQPA